MDDDGYEEPDFWDEVDRAYAEWKENPENW